MKHNSAVYITYIVVKKEIKDIISTRKRSLWFLPQEPGKANRP